MSKTKIIAIDAGHGFNTAGKRSPDGEREWSFNKQVVESVIKALGEYDGVKVLRTDDPTGKRDVPLKERTDKANKAGADVFISVHHNANTGKWGSWSGTETFCYPKSKAGRALADAIHPAVVKAYGLRDRGVKSANFHVLRETRMPAILIEGGFMDSTTDIKKLRDGAVLKRAGENIAESLAEYLGLKKTSKKPKPKPAPVKKSPKPTAYSGNSIVDYLRSVGIDPAFQNRKRLAKRYGINNYRGTAAQNTTLLAKLRGGNTAPKATKSIKQMADEVIAGKHGQGHTNRRKSLGISAADYEKVRAEVNRRLK